MWDDQTLERLLLHAGMVPAFLRSGKYLLDLMT